MLIVSGRDGACRGQMACSNRLILAGRWGRCCSTTLSMALVLGISVTRNNAKRHVLYMYMIYNLLSRLARYLGARRSNAQST